MREGIVNLKLISGKQSSVVLGRFILGVFALMLVVSFCLVSSASAKMTEAQKARIKASLAENVPMEQIIREASEAGVQMGDIVTTLVSAGADPAVVVSSAVTVSNSTGNTAGVSQAVSAALTAAGADAQQSIISAAIGAGADKGTVSNAAAGAGMSAGSTANAVSNAGTTQPPVYGYSAPEPVAPPPSYTPPAAPAIGGGGGGASTPPKPASPTEPTGVHRR